MGVTTNAANEHVEMHVDDKGVTLSEKMRDSDGEPRATTLTRVGKETKEKKAETGQLPPVPKPSVSPPCY